MGIQLRLKYCAMVENMVEHCQCGSLRDRCNVFCIHRVIIELFLPTHGYSGIFVTVKHRGFAGA